MINERNEAGRPPILIGDAITSSFLFFLSFFSSQPDEFTFVRGHKVTKREGTRKRVKDSFEENSFLFDTAMLSRYETGYLTHYTQQDSSMNPFIDGGK